MELKEFIYIELNKNVSSPRTIDFEDEIPFGVKTIIGEPKNLIMKTLYPLVEEVF